MKVVGWILLIFGLPSFLDTAFMAANYWEVMSDTTRQRTAIALVVTPVVTLLGAWLIYRNRRRP